MKVLHILRQKADAYPQSIIAAQRAAGDDVKVVMLQDAVLSCACDASSFCCKEDAEARGTSCGNLVDYKGIVDMVFDADSVINW